MSLPALADEVDLDDERYEGPTFADACRQADLEYQERRQFPPRPRPRRLPQSTLEALDWLIKYRPDRLSDFLTVRSADDQRLMEAHIRNKQVRR